MLLETHVDIALILEYSAYHRVWLRDEPIGISFYFSQLIFILNLLR